jgi:superfamily II DNA or RNA helicase
MSEYQWKIYISARSKEIQEEIRSRYSKAESVKAANKKPNRKSSGTYRVVSRQISNFVFPSNIKRPKPKTATESIKDYNKRVSDMYNSFTKKDLIDELNIYSPKMNAIIKNILSKKHSKDKIFIYSDFLTIEGINMIAKILELHGFTNYLDKRNKGDNYKRFIVWSGETSIKDRSSILEIFNSKKNSYGKDIKIFMATSAGAEGISLQDIRLVEILEPFWHRVRIEQVMGRASRLCSHINLPIDKRFVEINLYLVVQPKGSDIKYSLGEEDTTDMYLFKRSNQQKELLKQFLDAMKEIAFDCDLNYENNKSSVKECRKCYASGEPMYLPNIDDHIIPGNSKCNDIEENNELGLLTYKRREYGIDKNNNVYNISTIPAILIGKKIGKKIEFYQ